ncbi:MAG TPA: hypothetical protein VJM50_16825 [Pyrinomonadaceae bacterium]|nr:hypothetical protein [Pyrinomonadaceae bacterium]
MDEKQKTYVKAGIAVVAIAVVWYLLRNRNGAAPALSTGGLNGFQAPYFYTNAGIPDNTMLVNGGPTFQAVNTINLRTGNINGLSNAYMPMFGLVGMTAVGG